MIALTRIRNSDAVIRSFRGDKPRERLVDLMKEVRAKLVAGEEVKLEFPSKWSNTKDQLLAETHDKCAYCETPTRVVAFGDVEHYRPKSVYWWLAYCYDNYLASCAVCNQRFKGKKFEHAGPMMPAPPVEAAMTDEEIEEIAKTAIPDPLIDDDVAIFEEAHRTEKPLIPNPYIDKPEEIFAWDVLEGAQEIEVVARPGVPLAEKIVDAAERIYGLNRPELKRLRFDWFRIYNLSRLTADSPGVPQALKDMHLALIETMKQPNSQYAAMIRFFESDQD